VTRPRRKKRPFSTGDGHGVLLVNTNESKPPIGPLALDYLAQALEEAGLRTRLLDLAWAESAEGAVAAALAGPEPLLVALTVRKSDDSYFATQGFFLPRIKQIVELCRRHTDAPLVVGGMGFSIDAAPALEYLGADYGIWGEGEAALAELARRLALGKAPDDIPGLLTAGNDGPRCNPPRCLDLYALDAQRRAWVDNARYFREGGQGGFETKRGCYGRCVYCADPVGKGRRVRLRDPRAVAGELAHLVEQGVTCFHTCDSEFNMPPEHARMVCRAIIARGLDRRLTWYAYCAPAPFPGDLAELMARAGCVGICFGVDHGEPAMLRRLGREHTPTDILHMARRCRENGIRSMTDLLLGAPGENEETLAAAIEIIKRAAPDVVGISLGVRVAPGTPLAGRLAALEADPATRGHVHRPRRVPVPPGLAPSYYLDREIGGGVEEYVRSLIGGDERFLFAGHEEAETSNYNYDGHDLLAQAIREGARGAYWDILRTMNA